MNPTDTASNTQDLGGTRMKLLGLCPLRQLRTLLRMRFASSIPWSEMVRFGLMGLSSTGIYLVILAAIKCWYQEPLWLISAVAYLVSMAANYVMQRKVTFRSKRRHEEAVVRFVVVQLIGLGMNAGILDVLVTRKQLPFWLGQSLAVLVTSVWSYGAQKFLVFMKWGNESLSRSN